jgi:hypothetical protein
MKTSIRILATAVLLLAIACHAQEGGAADQGSSVAIISSVNGEARIAHPAGTQQPGQPKFRGPIIYGDHLSTGKDSSLGLLVGTNSLLTMRELSEVRIAETVRNKQILELAKGKVCLAVSRSTDLGAGPFTVRTPTSLITARNGTLLSIDVEEPPQTSRIEDQATKLVVLAAMSGQAPKASAVETIHVIEGSVDIVSLAPGSSATSLRTGQSLRVVGGVKGQPFASPPISCRAQDIQIIPVHTTTPASAQQMMVQQQMQLASAEPLPQQGVAAMSQVAAAGLSSVLVPGGLYLSYTDSCWDGRTTPATIRVTLPVEVAP